jgi:hypothetical protein
MSEKYFEIRLTEDVKSYYEVNLAITVSKLLGLS